MKVNIRVTEPGQGEMRIGPRGMQTILLVTPDDLDALSVAIEELRAGIDQAPQTWTVTSG